MDATPLPPPPVLVTRADLPKITAVLVVGYAAVCWLALRLDEYFAGDDAIDDAFYYPYVGYFLAVYTALLVLSRLAEHGAYTLYEALWGCNVSLVLVIMGVLMRKPFLVGVAMVTVSGDQLLWYIDAVTLLTTRKFSVGVMKYLTYPENRSFSKQFFATHHIWFLPLCLWVTTGHGGMHNSSFGGSCLLTTFLAFYCRAFTPFEVKLLGDDHILYLNVNGAYEFWKDVHISILHVLDHRHPLLYLPYLAVVGNLVANGVPHIIVMGIALTLNFHPMLQH